MIFKKTVSIICLLTGCVCSPNVTNMKEVNKDYSKIILLKDLDGTASKSEKLRKEAEEFHRNKQEQEEKLRLEEEQKRKEEELKRQQENEGQDVELLITYYGGNDPAQTSPECIMANGEEPYYGAIACPKDIPMGSLIKFNGKTFVCSDRGNPNYICWLDDGTMRVDVCIPINDGESMEAYRKRVRSYGTDRLTAKLIRKK